MESSVSLISTMQETSHLSLEKCSSPTNGNNEYDSDEGSSMEDPDFNWGEYLEETGAVAAPHTSFKHVEISLQSSFQPGMKLEVANKNNPDTYWVATIITTCGQLLLLRYCGYGEDRKADFWCDVMTADLHPVGWCTQNNKVLLPPDAEETEANRVKSLVLNYTAKEAPEAGFKLGSFSLHIWHSFHCTTWLSLSHHLFFCSSILNFHLVTFCSVLFVILSGLPFLL
uniref:Scm like with four mbt domains 2 n=1 Tax=Monodelphis domestica TaxID=13616 RepID=A0A5F8HDM2_MONDO